MRRSFLLGFAVAGLIWSSAVFAADSPHNVVLFVADGLRGMIVNRETAPAMTALRDEGVWFRNSHSLFPTFTTANASAMATGHYLGDTGDFSNSIFAGFRVAEAIRDFLDVAEVRARVDALDYDALDPRHRRAVDAFRVSLKSPRFRNARASGDDQATEP
jgi:Type I phosphodiesterase / nucleotide pyrophosphatase